MSFQIRKETGLTMLTWGAKYFRYPWLFAVQETRRKQQDICRKARKSPGALLSQWLRVRVPPRSPYVGLTPDGGPYIPDVGAVFCP